MAVNLKAINPTGAPPETKVFAQFTTASLTGIVTWVLTTYVFKGALPPQLATFLPYAVPAFAGLVAGWWAKHTPRPGTDIQTILSDMHTILLALQQAQPPVAGTVRFITPGAGGTSGGSGFGPGGGSSGGSGMLYGTMGGASGSTSGGGGSSQS